MDVPVFKEVAAIARIDAVKTILNVVCRTTGLGFSAVARVTEQQWIACAVKDDIAFGLKPGGELPLSTTICNEIRDHRQVVAIDDVERDAKYCNHHTPKQYGFKSYISAPITLPDGRLFGTLCAIDPRPAQVNNETTIGMFRLFADLIAQHLDAQQRMAANEQRMAASDLALRDERELSRLREQFIAVLGHDLRNPLSAIRGGAELLSRMPAVNDTAADLMLMIKRSAARMSGLINNVLDFARGRLGGGFVLDRKLDDGLNLALQQVVDELQTSNPARTFKATLQINAPVFCDALRVAQLLSNLIANALMHGDPASPIEIDARCIAAAADGGEGRCEVAVSNQGATIPPEVAARLFEPFVRGEAKPRGEGLGLGLFIATEIARAHAGTLDVQSADGRTCFRFQMPTHAP